MGKQRTPDHGPVGPNQPDNEQPDKAISGNSKSRKKRHRGGRKHWGARRKARAAKWQAKIASPLPAPLKGPAAERFDLRAAESVLRALAPDPAGQKHPEAHPANIPPLTNRDARALKLADPAAKERARQLQEQRTAELRSRNIGTGAKPQPPTPAKAVIANGKEFRGNRAIEPGKPGSGVQPGVIGGVQSLAKPAINAPTINPEGGRPAAEGEARNEPNAADWQTGQKLRKPATSVAVHGSRGPIAEKAGKNAASVWTGVDGVSTGGPHAAREGADSSGNPQLHESSDESNGQSKGGQSRGPNQRPADRAAADKAARAAKPHNSGGRLPGAGDAGGGGGGQSSAIDAALAAAGDGPGEVDPEAAAADEGDIGAIGPIQSLPGLVRPNPKRGELIKLQQILQHARWKIPPVAYDRLPNELVLLAMGKNPDGTPLAKFGPRTKMQAIRTLAILNRQTIESAMAEVRIKELELAAHERGLELHINAGGAGSVAVGVQIYLPSNGRERGGPARTVDSQATPTAEPGPSEPGPG